MQENKVLFKNTIIYTIGGIGSKLCAYFLVPLYTLSMSTSEYGIADLYYLTIQIACAVGTVKIASALVRFVLENKSEAKSLFTAAFKVIAAATAIIAVLYFFTGHWYFGKYGIPVYYFPLFFFLAALREIVAELVKALDHNKVYVAGGIIQSLTLLIASFVLLFSLKRGIRGYIEALILANAVSIVFYSSKMQVLQYIDMRLNSKKAIGDMICYTIFLVPAALAYWVIQASDRYMVNYFMGDAAEGMYAVAYKIPGICTAFSNFFISAWYISAIHEKENKSYYSKGFISFFNLVMIVAAGIIVFDKPLARLLFQREFFQAWEYAPVLIAASLFSICDSFFEVIFAVYKDTNAIFYTTAIGAIVNIIMNYLLIPLWGIQGAAISTLFSVALVFFVRYIRMFKKGYMQIYLIRAILNSAGIILLAVTYSFVSSNRIVYLGIEIIFILLLQKNTVADIFRRVADQIGRHKNHV